MVVNSGTIPTLKTDHWPASLRSPKFGQGVEAGPGIAISFKYPAIFVADGLLDPGDLAAGPAIGFRRGGEAGSCGFLRPVLDDRLHHGHDLGDRLRSLNAEHPLLLDRLRARRGPPLLGLAMHGGSRAIAGSSRDYSPALLGVPCASRSKFRVPLAARIDRMRDWGDAVHLSACHAPGATPRSLLEA